MQYGRAAAMDKDQEGGSVARPVARDKEKEGGSSRTELLLPFAPVIKSARQRRDRHILSLAVASAAIQTPSRSSGD
eukprot:1243988-Prymnesium_polylepis.1